MRRSDTGTVSTAERASVTRRARWRSFGRCRSNTAITATTPSVPKDEGREGHPHGCGASVRLVVIGGVDGRGTGIDGVVDRFARHRGARRGSRTDWRGCPLSTWGDGTGGGTRPPPRGRRTTAVAADGSACRVRPQRRTVAVFVGGQFEVPYLVRIDLTQAEPRTVANQPGIGCDGTDVDGLAQPRACDASGEATNCCAVSTFPYVRTASSNSRCWKPLVRHPDVISTSTPSASALRAAFWIAASNGGSSHAITGFVTSNGETV